ncbi:MAG: TIGR00725 family protein [bacterium]
MTRSSARPHVGVIGASACDGATAARAEEVGRLIARRGAVLVCGGMGGVMEAACRGALGAGGLMVGILPGAERGAANEFVDIAIATGLGEARNLAIIRTSDVLVAVAGSHGTLSEIGFALRMGKTVVGLGTWDVAGVTPADSPAAAVELAFRVLPR